MDYFGGDTLSYVCSGMISIAVWPRTDVSSTVLLVCQGGVVTMISVCWPKAANIACSADHLRKNHSLISFPHPM
jgi:hypothetical protein